MFQETGMEKVYAEPYSMKRIISLIEEDGNYKDWFVLARKKF